MRAFGLILVAGLLAAAEPARPVVLVTAFAPFAGRAVNGSATIAAGLEGVEVGGAVIRTAVMPVRWGEPGRTIPGLVDAHHPVVLLGLGEGHPGTVTVEREAANLAIRAPDTDGKPPASPRLEAGGPPSRAARFHLDQAWFPMPPVPVVPSDDAGGYLCNQALWTISGTRVAVAGFVHVPPQGDEPADAYRARLLPIVRELIIRNLPR